MAGTASAAPQRRSLGDGGWCWFADPRGVRYDGVHKRTYVGWVAQDGDIKITAYDHDSASRTTVLLEGKLQVDDHSNPALMVRPDGRLAVFYSSHNGNVMYYRVTTNPEDVSAWGPPQTLPTNTAGSYGYTYPNPLHLKAEGKTYLFWRGGNYNPTYSTLADGSPGWSPARNLITVAGQRPYVKYHSNGSDTINVAFTNAHPASAADVNIYYAHYRGGILYRANGTRIGSMGTPISPSQADKVYDTSYKAWVHDVAVDSSGRPVIVFAAFPSPSDHRYEYSRWDGKRWVTREITPAGGSISRDGKEPYYSGGITLDHEDPSTVYLSRDRGGVFEVETWRTADRGQTWSRSEVTAASSANNYRPISPRGLIPFSGDMSVVWMRGIYDSYVAYKTSITTLLETGGNHPPVADAERSPTKGPAPVTVDFDATTSSDPDGSVASWRWDFGDGSTGSGARVSHTYSEPGRYFPKLTAIDNGGSTDTYVTEVLVDPGSKPTASTGAASAITSTSATLNGTVNPRNQPTTYRFEYGTTTGYGATTPERSLPSTADSSQPVSADVTGLSQGTTYHYRLVATNGMGSTAGADNTFTAGSASGSGRYRDSVASTPGLAGYWRLGEAAGATAKDETGTSPGGYLGGYELGQSGALSGDTNTAARFDGVSGEMTANGPALWSSGTLEGWFDWRAGVAVMRDGTANGGWLLAFDSGGSLLYRLGGTSFNTGQTTASLRGGWHHVVATKDGGNVAFYVDGQLVHSATGAGSANAAMPWHVMRNGAYAQFSQGQADEVAVYNVALPAATIKAHYEAGRGATP